VAAAEDSTPLKRALFAPGAYTWGNKGDAALVASFINWLKEDFGAEIIELTSFTPVSDSVHYGVPVHHMFIRPMSRRRLLFEKALSFNSASRRFLTRLRMLQADVSSPLVEAWVRLYRRAPLVARLVGVRSLYDLTRSIDHSEFAFTVPGGYLLAPRYIDDWWLLHIPNIQLAKALGKAVILGPCSIGPFEDRHKRHMKRLLTNVDAVVLREEISREYLAELDFPAARVLQSPDIAFLHIPEPLSERGAVAAKAIADFADEAETVGVSVRDHSFPGRERPSEWMEMYLSAVVDSLAEVNDSGARVLVFSQTEEDWVTSQRLSAMLASRDVPHLLIDPLLAPSDLQLLYRDLSLLVGTRMHANILALTSGTPVAAIAYEPKTMGILRTLDLESWGVWIHDVGDGALVELVTAAWNERRERAELAVESQGAIRAAFASLAAAVSEVVSAPHAANSHSSLRND